MANKENNQTIEFVGVAVGDKVYFVSKAKAMEFVDGIDATKKEEKILNDLSADAIRDAIEKTGVKNPKKLDCSKIARKLLGKKYEKLSDDVQSLTRGVISAVANGALSVSAAKAAYDDVKETISKTSQMFDELKEKNEKLIEQVDGSKVEDTENKELSEAEEKAIKKAMKEAIDSLDLNNVDGSLESAFKGLESAMKNVMPATTEAESSERPSKADELNTPYFNRLRELGFAGIH